MATANQTVLKVLNHLNSKIGTGGVVDSGGSGTDDWYVKFANGFLIQGGTTQSENGTKTITFQIPFSNANYSFVLFPESQSNFYQSICARRYGTKSNTSVSVIANSSSGAEIGVNIDWFACGY